MLCLNDESSLIFCYNTESFRTCSVFGEIFFADSLLHSESNMLRLLRLFVAGVLRSTEVLVCSLFVPLVVKGCYSVTKGHDVIFQVNKYFAVFHIKFFCACYMNHCNCFTVMCNKWLKMLQRKDGMKAT